MEMSFHSQQIKLTFTRNILHLVSTLYFNCFEIESFKNSEMVYQAQLNRGVEIIYVMKRHTDHVDVSRVLIIED